MVIDQNKKIHFHTETGYGNPNLHFENAFNHVWSAIEDCLRNDVGKQCKVIVAGIAGIEVDNYRSSFQKRLMEKTKLPVIIVNDAVLAYESIFNGEDGIFTIAGTGSISYGRNGDKEGYAGGWGHLIGDVGSSYDIAIRACRQLTREFDEGSSFSSLSKVVMQQIGIDDPNGLKKFIYQSTKAEIATLTYSINLEAQKGNQTARQYFYQAGLDLAKQTKALYKKIQLHSPTKIAVKGSLLEKNQFVLEAFKTELLQQMDEIIVIQNDVSPAVGAYSIAKRHFGQERI